MPHDIPPIADSPRQRRRAARMTRGLVWCLALYAALVTAIAYVVLGRIGDGIDLSPNATEALHAGMIAHAILGGALVLAGLRLRRAQSCSPATPRCTLAFAALALVGSCDRIVGVAWPPTSDLDSQMIPHETRGWGLRPDAVQRGPAGPIRINARGFRGDEWARRESDDEYRILFLGDSVTFGFGLPLDAAFPSVVASQLRRGPSGLNVTALIAGVGGYATWQQRVVLEEEGAWVDPNLIVVGFCSNDMIDMIGVPDGAIQLSAKRFDVGTDSSPFGLVRMVRTLWRAARFRALRQRQLWANNRPVEDGAIPSIRAAFIEPLPDEVVAAWRACTDELDRIRAWCARRDTELIVVDLPFVMRFELERDGHDPHRPLRDWARRRGVTLIDGASFIPVPSAAMADSEAWPVNSGAVAIESGLVRGAVERLDVYMMDEVHPTADGHALIAGAVVEAIHARFGSSRRAD